MLIIQGGERLYMYRHSVTIDGLNVFKRMIIA